MTDRTRKAVGKVKKLCDKIAAYSQANQLERKLGADAGPKMQHIFERYYAVRS